MPTTKKRQQFLLDANKVKRVRKILQAETEEEAIENALNLVIENDKFNKAHEKFLKSDIDIYDTLGRLSK